MPVRCLLLVAALTVFTAACDTNASGVSPTVGGAVVGTTVEPTPVPQPCPAGPEVSQARLATLETGIIDAMEGYNGTWGAAVIDLACGTSVAVNPEYTQYTASAGKIVIVIGILRAVEEGTIQFAEVEPLILEVMHFSSDHAATTLNDMLTPAQVQSVTADSGVSAASTFEHAWDYADMPAIDLARVWAALLAGDLLTPRWTEYLLTRAGQADIPDGFETFPHEVGVEGYQYGQKAGYYVSDGIPYFFVGAGFVRPVGDPELDPGYALVWLGRTMNPSFLDPQRRTVFPLMFQYIQQMEADES